MKSDFSDFFGILTFCVILENLIFRKIRKFYEKFHLFFDFRDGFFMDFKNF